MKNLNLVSFLIWVFAISAQADSGVTNDLPDPILFCHESASGTTVPDGKEITLSRDQFGQTYLTVVQPSALQPIIENLLLNPTTCDYVVCEAYEADDAKIRVYISSLLSYLKSPETGTVHLVCSTAKRSKK